MGRTMRAALLGVLLAGFSLAAPTAAAAETPIEVSIQQRDDARGPDGLTMTVTNRGDRPCTLAATAAGTVEVLSVTRDGQPVEPEFIQTAYHAGFDAMLTATARQVAPGQSLSFPLTADAALAAVSPVPAGGLGSHWALERPGRYVVTAAYRMPAGTAADDGPVCDGASAPATAALEVGSAGNGLSWLVIAGIAVGALVLVLLVVLLLRRRSRTGVVVLVLLAVVAGQFAPPRVARAAIQVVDGGDAGFRATAEGCLSLFRGNDPKGPPRGPLDPAKIMPFLDGPFKVWIKPVKGELNVRAHTTPDWATIYWDHDNHKPLHGDPTVSYDPCSALYHELTHAFDGGNNQLAEGECAAAKPGKSGTRVPIRDVRAVRAENEFRASQGFPPRNSYGPRPLPPGKELDAAKIKADCDKGKDSKPARGGPSRSDLVPGGSVGDPHLTTFDRREYDFQAVGEFVLARAPQWEVQVRQAPLAGSRTVSVNQQAALRVGADRVVFDLAADSGAPRILLNGRQIHPLDERLPGGGRIVAIEEGHTVTFPDGSEADIDPIGRWGLHVLLFPRPELGGKLSGLLGDLNGDPGNDLSTKDGKPLPEKPSREQLYGEFADRWRVGANDPLLDYPAGRGTADYTDRSFPDKEISVADLPAPRRDAAQRRCAALWVSGQALDGCTLDLALTGQTAFARSAAAMTETMTRGPQPRPRPGEQGVLRDGSTVSGRVDKPGTVHTYRLELGDATVFRLHEVRGDLHDRGKLEVNLEGPYDPDSPGFTITSVYQYRVLKGGKYTLTVTGDDGATGNFAFRLNTAKERRIPAGLGDTVRGTLDVPGRVDLYGFQATAEVQLVPVDGSGCEFTMALVEDGASLTAHTPHGVCYGVGMGRLEPGKRYVLAVWSSEGRTGTYSFRLTGEN
ncbi:VWD domain-containing protein [Crossiella sp. SN42]|uniref:VWD domain-containing protein n=1 Tax=Crossiella sp. SN42 TaxID=2944808 RepID=UPI00207CB7F1|nr:VWD domain-containing protein [Crossiella sp. SN42]MCO1574238.1 VWD domain-containing protein [Crossiella sp. SN42]